MSALDDLLRSMINQAKEKFPDAGILFVAVEDSDDEEDSFGVTYMTNMGPEEMHDVVNCLVEPEGTPQDVTHH